MKIAIERYRQKYRYSYLLLREMVITDFKLRYQGSTLGYLWSLLRPLMLFAILYVVFAKFFRLGDSIPFFPVYLLTGIVLWNFFVEVTNNGVQAIVSKGELIRKTNFPKYVIILATTFSAIINLVLNSLVIAVFMVFSGVEPSWGMLLAPIFVLEIIAFALACAFLLSALFVRVRDINYIWEVIMQGAFYATPILYPLSLVIELSPSAAKLLLLNPMAQAMQDVRYFLITNQTDTLWSLASLKWYAIPWLIVIGLSVLAVFYFRKRSPYFAEEV